MLNLLFAVLWCGLGATLPDGQVISPETVSKHIDQVGAGQTLQALYANDARWATVRKGIASGTLTWLKVAKRLSPGDAHAGEDLAFAVGEALEHRPDNVLRVFGVQAECNGPDIDDPRYDGYKSAIRAVEMRQRMLRTVDDRFLIEARDRCIATLEKSKEAIARFYGVAPRAAGNNRVVRGAEPSRCASSGELQRFPNDIEAGRVLASQRPVCFKDQRDSFLKVRAGLLERGALRIRAGQFLDERDVTAGNRAINGRELKPS